DSADWRVGKRHIILAIEGNVCRAANIPDLALRGEIGRPFLTAPDGEKGALACAERCRALRKPRIRCGGCRRKRQGNRGKHEKGATTRCTTKQTRQEHDPFAPSQHPPSSVCMQTGDRSTLRMGQAMRRLARLARACAFSDCMKASWPSTMTMRPSSFTSGRRSQN